MSAQTGIDSIAPPPPTSRGIDRVRGQVKHWQTTPNPIWVREMRQSARLSRTPFILMAITALSALLLCTIGGVLTGNTDPATIGAALFHVFFSVAFFVVTLAGPTLAANSIASEREGRTWEAVQLTGLAPGVIARGKFTAAFTNIAMYIVMMAPVGALPFLFGGVTATEVIVAFIWLFIFAGLSVAAGLALSSKMDSMRGALVVTLLLTFFLSPIVYVSMGVGLSFAAHDIWHAVPEGPPVWLPTAYERAPFGLQYLGLLIALPALTTLLPGWFLYEVTIANLTNPSDDRSTRLRIWNIVSSLLFTGVVCGAALFARPRDRAELTEFALCCYLCFLVFNVFVFAGEPIGPSRRVNLHWDRQRASKLKRFLGPGIIRASTLMLLTGVGALAAATAVALLVISIDGGTTKGNQLGEVLAVGFYAATFSVFLIGFTAWARARTNSPGTARIFLLIAIAMIGAGPWIIAAIAGAFSSSGTENYLIAAPSPIFALYTASRIHKTSSDAGINMIASSICGAAWALFGLALLGRASSKCTAILREHAEAIHEMDTRLAAEDEAANMPPQEAVDQHYAPDPTDQPLAAQPAENPAPPQPNPDEPAPTTLRLPQA